MFSKLYISLSGNGKQEENVIFNDALMCYSFRLAVRDLLYEPSHRQDSTYFDLCETSRRTLAGTRNSSMGTTMKD